MSWNKAGVEGAGQGAQAIEKCKHVFPVECRVRWGGDRSVCKVGGRQCGNRLGVSGILIIF